MKNKLLIEQQDKELWRLVMRECTYEGLKPGRPFVIQQDSQYPDLREQFDKIKSQQELKL